MIDFWQFWPLWLVLTVVLILLVLKKLSKNGTLTRATRYGLLLFSAASGFLISVFSNSINEADFFSRLDLLNASLEHRNLSDADSLFNQFYVDNIIFIDNFYARDPIREITRRDLLAKFLKELRKGVDYVDLILFDMLFIDTVNGQDDSLIQEILFFAEKGKIALANDIDPKFQYIRSGLNEDQLFELYGEVNFRSKEGISLSQYLYFDSTFHLARKPSLPYLCYRKLNPGGKISDDYLVGNFVFNRNDLFQFRSNHFVTPHFINDGTIYSGSDNEVHGSEIDNFQSLNCNYFDLNDCVKSGNMDSIITLLEERAKRNKQIGSQINKNIIVVGSVLDNADLHQTAFGKVYGIEIILNGLVYMQLGYLKKHSTFILQSFIIFIFFSIFLYVIKRCSETYKFKEFRLKYFGTIWYIIVKCSEEIAFMLIIFFWIYWTQYTLFAFNFFFPLLVVLLVIKAIIIVENS